MAKLIGGKSFIKEYKNKNRHMYTNLLNTIPTQITGDAQNATNKTKIKTSIT